MRDQMAGGKRHRTCEQKSSFFNTQMGVFPYKIET